MSKKTQIEVICSTCGKPKTIPMWKYRNNKNKRFYCDTECKLVGTRRKINTVCDYCGKNYEVHKSQFERTNKHYCCTDCKYKGQNKTILINCSWCDKEIVVCNFELNRSNNHFCDKKCQGLFKRNKIDIKCSNCNNDLKTYPSRINSQNNCFCNSKCMGEWMSKNLLGENNPKYNSIKTTCCYCSNEIVVKNNQFIMYNSHFCDKICYGKWQVKNRTAESNFNWRGGKSFEKYPVSFNNDVKNKIKERDGYKCQICGKIKGSDLHIHHIDYIKENTYDENLITLCNSCHSKTNGNRKIWERWFNSSSSFWFATRCSAI